MLSLHPLPSPLALTVYVSGNAHDADLAALIAIHLRGLGARVVSQWHRSGPKEPRAPVQTAAVRTSDALVLVGGAPFSKEVLGELATATTTGALRLFQGEMDAASARAAGLVVVASIADLEDELRELVSLLAHPSSRRIAIDRPSRGPAYPSRRVFPLSRPRAAQQPA